MKSDRTPAHRLGASSCRPVVLTWCIALCTALQACGGDGGSDGSTAASINSAPLPAPASEAAAGMAAAPQAGASPGNPSCGFNPPAGIRDEVLSRINQIRAAGATCGTDRYGAAPALTWNTVLLQAAAAHTADMASKNYFAHNSQDGRTAAQRLLAAGYSYSSMGENIAAGQASVESVMNGWLNSPGHCKNLLNPVFRDVAVACTASSTAKYGFYWAMELGRPL